VQTAVWWLVICIAACRVRCEGGSSDRLPGGSLMHELQVTKQHANGDTDTAESAVGCGFLLKQVLLPTLMSPVVYCVVLGLLINVAPGIELPGFAVGTLSTLGSAFAPLSLFALGMSMADKQTEGLEEEEEAAAAGELDSKDDGSGGPWVQTLLLIGAKSLGLPLVARFLALAFTGNEDLSRFAFVYATFPPSSQTYLFAQRFNLDVGDLKRIARPTVVGTVVAAPIMFAAAEMTQIELTFDPSDPNPEGGQQVQALTLVCARALAPPHRAHMQTCRAAIQARAPICSAQLPVESPGSCPSRLVERVPAFVSCGSEVLRCCVCLPCLCWSRRSRSDTPAL
jgi:hypothetical protein